MEANDALVIIPNIRDAAWMVGQCEYVNVICTRRHRPMNIMMTTTTNPSIAVKPTLYAVEDIRVPLLGQTI